MTQQVHWTTEEKVGFPHYSNVVIRGGITRDIPDDADAVAELTKVIAEVDQAMEPERVKVAELLALANKNA